MEGLRGTSYLSQGDGSLWFGLGHDPVIHSLRAVWPGGGALALTDVSARQQLRLAPPSP